MKRLALLFLLLVLMLCGCNQEYGILEYQSNIIEAECTINEKYSGTFTKDSSAFSLVLSEPQKLSGIKFLLENDKLYIIKNDLVIEASKTELNGIYALLHIFSLDEATITTALQNSVITFENSCGAYILTFGENNLPQKLEINGNGFEYDITINTIMLTEK